MGYNKVSYNLIKFKDSVVFLYPKPIELSDVVLTNEKLGSKEIIKKVAENIEKNYEKRLTKSKIFLSRKSISETKKLNINKFKSSIKEINSLLLDSILNNLSQENSTALEVLCYYYGNIEDENQKINLIKSRETFDKGDDLLRELNNKLEQALKENIKSDSYFKIKSGFFGGNLELDGLEEVDSIDAKEKLLKEDMGDFASNQKNTINRFYSRLFYNKETPFNFILKPNKFTFSEPNLDFIADKLVYKIDCIPKGGSKYKGTLYIDSDDFAVIRLDFINVKSIFKFKLLGVSFDQYFRDGKILFSKFENDKYNLSYAQVNSSQTFFIDRPIRLIEKNKNVKGRRKQNEISFKMDMGFDQKYKIEIQVFESNKITKNEFENLNEDNKVLPEFLEEFKTNFWQEF